MSSINTKEQFFQPGGTLPLTAPYIERFADEELLYATLLGEYCNVLTPRQMGKSSLMVRTSGRLHKKGVRTATIDLTQIGTKLDASEWYYGLISQLRQQLGLAMIEKEWWNAHAQKGVVQRFSDFLRYVILEEIAELVVIFVDEIDSTLGLPFTDDFFAAIRAAYNARASDPAYKRLTFVLLGVARPGDLIKDRSRTPYNIGQSIDLGDFTLEEAKEFLLGLEAVFGNRAKVIMECIHYWTGGHPYLTQKVCAEIVKIKQGNWDDEQIDLLVKQLFLSDEARKESNLQYINDRIQESRDREKLLQTYRQVLTRSSIPDEERDPIKSQLKLIGLVKVTPQGALVVRNRIYEAAFDQHWIKARMPKLTSTRITIAAIIIAVVALLIVGILFYRQQNSNEILADTYTQEFLSAQSAPIRITNLAGLFQLDNEFAVNARSLFFGLDANQQMTIFADLSTPEQVGPELQIVIEEVYTHLQDNNQHNNALLQAMVDDLNKIEITFPDSRILASEIEAWLEGRQQAQAGNDQAAIEAYTRATDYNNQNPGVYLDRAAAYTRLGQNNNALLDLGRVVELDPERHLQIGGFIRANPVLGNYLANHQQDFPTLVDLGKE